MRKDGNYCFCTFENCNSKFSRPDRLATHMRLHSGERPFICTFDGCSKGYTSLSHLKRHESIHEGRFSCTVKGCPIILKTPATLKKHLEFHEPKRKRKKYQCSECNKEFSKHNWLRMHTFKHTGIKPFVCTENNCGKRFLYPCKLKNHMRKHAGYKCSKPNCNEIFPTWTSYVRHFRVAHPKMYKCSVCGKEFFTSYNRNAHEAIHKEDKDVFPCPAAHCLRYYYRKNNLDEHIKVYHEQRQYVCNLCHRRYITEDHLEAHVARFHENRKRKKKKKSKRKWTFAEKLAGMENLVKNSLGKRKKSSSSGSEDKVNSSGAEKLSSNAKKKLNLDQTLTQNAEEQTEARNSQNKKNELTESSDVELEVRFQLLTADKVVPNREETLANAEQLKRRREAKLPGSIDIEDEIKSSDAEKLSLAAKEKLILDQNLVQNADEQTGGINYQTEEGELTERSDVEIEVRFESQTAEKVVSNQEETLANAEELILAQDLTSDAKEKPVDDNSEILKIKYEILSCVENLINDRLNCDKTLMPCHCDENESMEVSALDLLEAIMACSGVSIDQEN